MNAVEVVIATLETEVEALAAENMRLQKRLDETMALLMSGERIFEIRDFFFIFIFVHFHALRSRHLH